LRFGATSQSLKNSFRRLTFPQRLEAAVDLVQLTARVKLVPFPFVLIRSFSAKCSGTKVCGLLRHQRHRPPQIAHENSQLLNLDTLIVSVHGAAFFLSLGYANAVRRHALLPQE